MKHLSIVTVLAIINLSVAPQTLASDKSTELRSRITYLEAELDKAKKELAAMGDHTSGGASSPPPAEEKKEDDLAEAAKDAAKVVIAALQIAFPELAPLILKFATALGIGEEELKDEEVQTEAMGLVSAFTHPDPTLTEFQKKIIGALGKDPRTKDLFNVAVKIAAGESMTPSEFIQNNPEITPDYSIVDPP